METAKYAKMKNKKVCVTAIDASKAFDKVNRMTMWDLLLKKTNKIITRAEMKYQMRT